MATRYKIVGKGMTFRNAGSYGLRSLAENKARYISYTLKGINQMEAKNE